MLSFDDVRDLLEEWEVALPDAEYHAKLAEYVDGMCLGQPGRAELLACDGAEHLMATGRVRISPTRIRSTR